MLCTLLSVLYLSVTCHTPKLPPHGNRRRAPGVIRLGFNGYDRNLCFVILSYMLMFLCTFKRNWAKRFIVICFSCLTEMLVVATPHFHLATNLIDVFFFFVIRHSFTIEDLASAPNLKLGCAVILRGCASDYK